MKNYFIYILFLVLTLLSTSLPQSLGKKLIIESFKETPLNTPGNTTVRLLVHTKMLNLNISSDKKIIKQIKLNENDYDVYLENGTHIFTFEAEGIDKITTPAFNFDLSYSYELALNISFSAQKNRVVETLHTVTFHTNLDSCLISHGKNSAQLNENKAVEYKLSEGTYTFLFSRNGYSDIEKTISLKKDMTVQIEFLRKTSGTSEQTIFTTPFDISSTPSNAEILIDGKSIGFTPLSGKTYSGHHTISLISKEYYPEIIEANLIKNEPYKFNSSLTPHFGYLNISCGLQNGNVFINDSLIGETPLVMHKLPSKSYTLRIEAKGFSTYQSVVSIYDEETSNIDICLRRYSAGLVVDAVNEKGAEVYINNIKVGETPYVNLEMRPDTYQLKLVKAPYNDIIQSVTLTNNDTLQKEFFFGTDFAQITILADSCDISLNEVVKGHGKYSEKIRAGLYLLGIFQDEQHFGISKKIDIKQGDKIFLQFKPSPVFQELSVNVKPREILDAQVFIDNTFSGEAPTKANLGIGTHIVQIKKAGYPDLSRSVTLNKFYPESITFSMTSIEESRLFSERLKFWQWNTTYLGITGAAGAVVFRVMADSKYNTYKSTSTPSGAVALHNDVKKYNSLFNTTLGVIGACTVTSATLWLWRYFYE